MEVCTILGMENSCVKEYSLSNGLKIFIKPTSTPLVCVQVGVKVGSIHEDHLLGYGLSHYLEHLLFKGTQKRTSLEIDQTIEAAGGQHNAYTNFDRTVYYVTGLADKLSTYLDVLLDMVYHSTLQEDLLEDERGVILKEIKMYLDDPWDVLARQASWGSLKASPYRYPIIGFENSLKNLKREDLWNYYKKTYVPQNTFIAIVGGVDPDATFEQIKSLVDGLPAGEYYPDPVTRDLPEGSERTLRLTGPYEQAYGLLEFAVPYKNSPYQVALAAFTQAIGGGESSILWKTLYDEKALVHSISASYDRLGEQGNISIAYLADPGKEASVEAAIFEVLDKVKQEGISLATLDRVKRQARVGILDRLKTVEGQTHSIVSNYRVFKDPMHSDRFLKALEALQPKDLQEVATLFCTKWNSFAATLNPGGPQMDLADAPKSLPIQLGEKATPEAFEAFQKAFLQDGWEAPILTEINPKNFTKALQLPKFETQDCAGIPVFIQGGETLPKIHLNITFEAGLRVEEADKRGICQLLATFLRRSRPEIVERFENLGAMFTEVAGAHSLAFAIEVLEEDFAEGVRLLTEALQWPENSPLNQSLFDREKTTQLEAIKNQLDNITVNGFWALRKIVFKDSPYSDPVLGRNETVSNLQLQDLKNLWQEVILKSNAKISVAGKVDDLDVIQILQPLAESLNEGSIAIKTPAIPEWSEQSREVVLSGREQAVLYQAYPIFGDYGMNDERYTLMVMQEMMSSMGGSLFRSVRDAGLGYYASTRILSGWNQGALVFFAGTEPSQEAQDAVWQAFDKEVERLMTTFLTEDELQRAKIGCKVAFETAWQAMGTRAQTAINAIMMGYGVNHWQEIAVKIDAVTKESVQAFAKKYFPAANGKTRLKIGPA